MKLLHVVLDILDAALRVPDRNIANQQRKRATIQKIREENEHENSWLFNGSGGGQPGYLDSHEMRRKQAMEDQLEFDLIVFLYAMNNDDGIISKDEREMIEQHIIKYKDILDAKSVKALQKRLPDDPTLDTIIYFIQDHQLSEKDVQEGLSQLKQLDPSGTRYGNALFQIEQTIIARLDYLN